MYLIMEKVLQSPRPTHLGGCGLTDDLVPSLPRVPPSPLYGGWGTIINPSKGASYSCSCFALPVRGGLALRCNRTGPMSAGSPAHHRWVRVMPTDLEPL
jgi:hypothetical protein